MSIKNYIFYNCILNLFRILWIGIDLTIFFDFRSFFTNYDKRKGLLDLRNYNKNIYNLFHFRFLAYNL